MTQRTFKFNVVILVFSQLIDSQSLADDLTA